MASKNSAKQGEPKNNPSVEFQDLGFGNKLQEGSNRFINKDGSFNIRREGMKILTPYQTLLEISWQRFFVIIVIAYIGINAIFALIFVILGIENLSGYEPNGFVDDFSHAFYFSVQTFTTVGYGSISPFGHIANLVAAFDALAGLISFALATGLFFARFSKPKAMILFSQWGIIAPYQDGWSFQFRIANKRDDKMIDLEAQLVLTWLDLDNGRRRFAPLELERSKVVLFPLNWTIVHPIDESSPLFEKNMKDLMEMEVEFLVIIKGYDETFADLVHINTSYTCEEIKWGYRFLPMYKERPGDGTILELDKIDLMQATEEGEKRK